MPNLSLPSVTLLLIETRENELANLAVRDCLRRVTFGDVLIFTNAPETYVGCPTYTGEEKNMMEGQRVRVVAVPDWPDKMGWSRWTWQGAAPYVRTTHALCIQWDSWVTEPGMWRPEYLDYDYIGAPWWYKDGMNVGNGGFCLRSTKLMRYLRKHRDRLPCKDALDDDLLCRRYRPTLEQEGFTWAPEALASDFAFEVQRPSPHSHHFGFHACYNFAYGCSGDEERLMERARLMSKSRYMTVSNPYFWQGFAKANPNIFKRLAEEEGVDLSMPQTRAEWDEWCSKNNVPLLTDYQWGEIEARRGQGWMPRQTTG